jgi:hypothetical protein
LANALFVLKLRERKATMEPLDARILALNATILYLNANPLFARLELTALLASLAHALNDVSQGAKPGLIFACKRRGGGRPRYLAKAVIRAQIVLIFEMLVRAGQDKQTASKWLASRLKKQHLLYGGRTIEAKQIVRWRSELNGKSLSGSDAAYRILKEGVDRGGWPVNPAEARNRAARLLKSPRFAGF